MRFEKLRAAARPRSALRSDAGLPQSEAGEYADFTERAAARQKASATECTGMGSIRKRPLKKAAFSASFSDRYVRHCLSFDFIVLLLGRALLSIGAYQVQRLFRRTYKPICLISLAFVKGLAATVSLAKDTLGGSCRDGACLDHPVLAHRPIE
jgi:hypothetical protein